MASKKTPAPEPLRLEAALSGLLTLAVLRLDHDGVQLPDKIEVVLDKAGLNPEETASVTGKTPGAVRKTLERACK